MKRSAPTLAAAVVAMLVFGAALIDNPGTWDLARRCMVFIACSAAAIYTYIEFMPRRNA